MQNIIIKVRLNSGKLTDVPVCAKRVQGLLALHRPVGWRGTEHKLTFYPGWMLVHIPTGWAVERFNCSLSQAERVLNAAAALDWSAVSTADRTNDALQAAYWGLPERKTLCRYDLEKVYALEDRFLEVQEKREEE